METTTKQKTTWQQELKKQETNNRLKTFGIWIIALLILGISVWGLMGATNSATTQQVADITPPKVSDQDIAIGPKEAKVTLIEYADFQCPGCGSYHPLVKQLLKDENGKIRFIYRFFPLTSIHKNAMQSAEVAYAALLQNKFWEMHDMLFEHQKDWANLADPTSTFNKYAQSISLDMTKFQADVKAQTTKDFIQTQSDAGTSAGVNSTPTFFVNGKHIALPNGYEEFKKVIDAAL